MFERFNKAARRTVVRAQQESFERNTAYVGAEHLLTALSLDAGSVAGTALVALGLDAELVRELAVGLSPGLTGGRPMDPDALATLGIDLDEVRRAVDGEFGRGALARGGRLRDKAHAPFSAEAKKLLELALREAVRRKDGVIGTEHLLLAAVALPVGAAVLADAGRTPEQVRAAVEAELDRRRLSA